MYMQKDTPKEREDLISYGLSENDADVILAANRIAQFFGWSNSGYGPGASFHSADDSFINIRSDKAILDMDKRLSEIYGE